MDRCTTVARNRRLAAIARLLYAEEYTYRRRNVSEPHVEGGKKKRAVATGKSLPNTLETARH